MKKAAQVEKELRNSFPSVKATSTSADELVNGNLSPPWIEEESKVQT